MSIVVRFAPRPSPPPSSTTRPSGCSRRGPATARRAGLPRLLQIDGKLRVSEIWDSQEQFEAFGERLMPILEQVGIDPGQPEIHQVHNTIKR